MIKRELYMKKIRPFMNQDIIKVLTGIRLCGKSVMLELIKQEFFAQGIQESQCLTANFESKMIAWVGSVDAAYQHITEFAHANREDKIYLLFDEIQELPGWEKLVNACMIDFNADIYITGSNAKLLSGELATYLAGRYVEINIYPFSFQEVMLIEKDKPAKDVFQSYLIKGGMPFLYQFPSDEYSTKQYLQDIYHSIILKDIAERNKIRDLELLQRILLYFLSNMGNTFSAANIVKYLKNEKRTLSNETIYNYINYATSACLIHLSPREDVMGKKLLQFQEKIYLTDHGMREAIYGNNLRDIQQTLENIVYMELLRRGYQVFIGKCGEREVDFVAINAADRLYIQVTYLLASKETIEREFLPLEKIPDNYPKYVISMDEIDFSKNGIRHKNITDWLLNPMPLHG